MNSVILVVAAHADDEVLGCGGTLARHVRDGDTVHVVFMADGVTSRGQVDSHEQYQREAAAKKAQSALGVASVRFLSLPDNRMDSVALLDVVQPLERAMQELAPDIIYTHHDGDLNVDHRITHQAVMTACRPVPGQRVRKILTFEVMSSTEWSGSGGQRAFIPNVYVDITAYWNQKLQALLAYEYEMRPPPHSRSIEHLDVMSLHRGFEVGVSRAEAFYLVRAVK